MLDTGSPDPRMVARRGTLRHGPILRCSTLSVAVRSLAALFGVAPDRLGCALRDAATTVEAHAEAELARDIVPALTAILGRRAVTPRRIHFFHGTRTFDPQLFAQRGLLPLSVVIDDLWARMRGLAPEVPPEDFAALREGPRGGTDQCLDVQAPARHP